MKKTAYLGIDVSKGYADLILIDKEKVILEPVFRLDDTSNRLQILESIAKKCTSLGYKMVCAAESTGGYENHWLDDLLFLSLTYPIQVARVNPKAVKGISDACLTRTITDAVSALNIAYYLISFENRIDFLRPSQNVFKEERSFYNMIRLNIKQRTQLYNQFEKIIYQYFPKLMLYCRHGVPNWLLNLLLKYPTIESIKKAGVEKIQYIKGIGPQKAESIIKKLEDCPVNGIKKISILTIKHQAQEILRKDELIGQMKKEMIQQYMNHPLVKLLISIVGIGYETATILLFEIEDIRRFDSAKKMASYFGVNPVYKQSGDGTWGNRISKKGRKTVRGILYMSALTAVNSKKTDIFRNIYARMRQNGKGHYDASVVVIHKLIRVIYGVLQGGTEFNGEIDKLNQERSQERQEKKKEEGTERERGKKKILVQIPTTR